MACTCGRRCQRHGNPEDPVGGISGLTATSGVQSGSRLCAVGPVPEAAPRPWREPIAEKPAPDSSAPKLRTGPPERLREWHGDRLSLIEIHDYFMPAGIEIVITVVIGEPHAIPGASETRLPVTPADHAHRWHLTAHGSEHARPQAIRRVEPSRPRSHLEELAIGSSGTRHDRAFSRTALIQVMEYRLPLSGP